MTIEQDDEENLAPLVRGELAAVETYKQALEKVGGIAGGAELRRIESEHEDAVRELQEHMTEWDVKPPEDSGLWGSWAKAVEATAKVFGVKAAIKALKEGEEKGIHDYEDALRNEALDAEIRQIISSDLLPKTREHVTVLNRLLQQPGAAR
ncbi:MAG: DUF2383 domain-containing protein [Elusimicrobia bacterium]|nr:DUF2383 domain-containing protein [Elusimicrobiota bacterium]